MTRLTVRSKMLKIRNLPKEHRRLGVINSKPVVLFVVLLGVGIVLVAMKQNFLIGIILITLSLYNMLFIRGDHLVEFYDDYVVFYHINANKDECYLVFWEDIAAWQIQRNGMNYDELVIGLKNHQTIRFQCVSKMKLERYFKRCVNNVKKEDVITSKTM